jgi:hypothetical protein
VEKIAGNRTQAIQPLTIPTELSQLLNRREVFQNPFHFWYLYLIQFFLLLFIYLFSFVCFQNLRVEKMPGVNTCGPVLVVFLLDLLFDTEDGANIFLQNDELLPELMALHLRR